MNARHTFDDVETALRTAGMSFPEVTEDFPWGHRALKVRGKAFVFIARELGGLSLSVKLPESNAIALSMPFVAPTGYGLGRSGWVTATLPAAAHVPLAVLLSWLEESYRAIAPKRLSRTIQQPAPVLKATMARPRTTTRRPSSPRRSRSS